MFTGIVDAQGEISSVLDATGGVEIQVRAPDFFSATQVGDSVAVNGVCLTVVSHTHDEAQFFAQIETIRLTTIASWTVGEGVNLEHPMTLADRLGGHIVQGHVDAVARVSKRDDLPDGSSRITFIPPIELMRYISLKGSVCLNGVSLTVARRDDESFDVAFIPVTLENTTFGECQAGARVNIEVDCLARYVEQLLPTIREA